MNSSDPPAYLLAAAATLQRHGRVPEALAAYESLLARWRHLPDSWFNLALLQRQARRFHESLESYEKAIALGLHRPEEAHVNRGVIYADYLSRPQDAEAEYRKALSLNPDHEPALLNLANLAEDLGRRQEAQAMLERLLAENPTHYGALARLANLVPDQRVTAGLIERLSAALGDPATGVEDQAALGFALGRLLDARGRYAQAFAAYEAANRASRASGTPPGVEYDREAATRLVDDLIAVTSGRSTAPCASGEQAAPVFICGMFRSGSTLVEQLLAAHPAVTAGGELDAVSHVIATRLSPYPAALATASSSTLSAAAGEYLRELRTRFPAAQRVTDKRPDNYLHVGLIKLLFPRARIVHTVRNPLDNCLSVYFLHLDHRMPYALDLLDIAHHYRQYRRLMNHWHDRYGDDIHEVDYDEFVREPAPTARRLFEFLGLRWDEAFLDSRAAGQAVKTASVWQVREPIYKHSSGRHRHYARELGPLRAALAELLPAADRYGGIV